MDDQNCKLPFNPEALISENGAMQTCSQAESIAQNLMLLIITKKGEDRFDPDYGNAVWDIEFESAVTTVEWETVFVKSLKEQIEQYEPRIIDPKVSVSIEYVEHSYDTRHLVEIKKRAKIAINAKLVETGELFKFSTELFLSPMSVE